MPPGTGSGFASLPMPQAITSAEIPGPARERFTGRAAGVEDAADGASGEVASSPPVSSESEVLRHSSLRFLAVRMSERSGLGW
jgi:hypothetical protein